MTCSPTTTSAPAEDDPAGSVVERRHLGTVGRPVRGLNTVGRGDRLDPLRTVRGGAVGVLKGAALGVPRVPQLLEHLDGRPVIRVSGDDDLRPRAFEGLPVSAETAVDDFLPGAVVQRRELWKIDRERRLRLLVLVNQRRVGREHRRLREAHRFGGLERRSRARLRRGRGRRGRVDRLLVVGTSSAVAAPGDPRGDDERHSAGRQPPLHAAHDGRFVDGKRQASTLFRSLYERARPLRIMRLHDDAIGTGA